MSARRLTCRPLDDDPAMLVRRYLAEPVHRWSVGTYGAIGLSAHGDRASHERATELPAARPPRRDI